MHHITDAHENPASGSTHQPPRLLYLAPQTRQPIARSGIQRVTVQAARALINLAQLDFVKWDAIDGQLRYFDVHDLDLFFGSQSWPTNVHVNRFARRIHYRFEETLSERHQTWLLMPEISYHLPSGADSYAAIIAQMREYRVRTAAVFYDLIPITNALYQQHWKVHHERYVRELLKVDLILPISTFSANQLKAYYNDQFQIDDGVRESMRQVIVPVSLATEANGGCPHQTAHEANEPRDMIVLLGTVEPRKRQIEVMRAFKRLRLAERYGLKVVVIGFVHPATADEFARLSRNDCAIEYIGHADDEQVSVIFRRARFSVFASNDEGFGLPICESLARGVPCLAANFGAMKEVGDGGGCLLVDVNDDDALDRGLELLAHDDTLVDQLRDEIARRKIRTWNDYAHDVVQVITAYSVGDNICSIADDVRAKAMSFLGRPPKSTSDFTVYKVSAQREIWSVVLCRNMTAADLTLAAREVQRNTTSRSAIIFVGSNFDFDVIDSATVETLFGADVWVFEDRSMFERLVGLADVVQYHGMLPTRCGFASSDKSTDEVAAATIKKFVEAINHRHYVASREAALDAPENRNRLHSDIQCLNIIISTYNRAPFVAENVRWLLSHLEAFGGKIRLTVVDNASNDDTQERLSKFKGHPYLEVIQNVTNVGILGNLQVCSTVLRAPHSWIIGDDDFILPSALARVFEAIVRHSYLPFVFINFGFYRRAQLGIEGQAENLMVNAIFPAPTASPSGLHRVIDIAAERDNLLTTIYPAVFRTDIMSACFNFTGQSLGPLLEAVPTTKIILESYAYTKAFWISEPGIVKNADSSRQRHGKGRRGVLMPLVFELAREAGINSQKLHQWSKLHLDLCRDVANPSSDQSKGVSFGQEVLDASFRVFRTRLE